MSVRRSRWIGPALGAVVMAGVLAAGGVIVPSFATTSSGDRAIFEPLPPARILNTRPGGPAVGGTIGPVGNGQSFELQVTGVGGVPADATAVVMNVTYADSGGDGFITIWPAGSTRPNASNLNTVKNGPPTPNLVTVQVGSGGRVSFYNFGGNVNLIADVAGYYRGHDHDDRYYSKALVDAGYYSKAQVDAGYYSKAQVDSAIAAVVASTAPKVTQVVPALNPGTYNTVATNTLTITHTAPSAGVLVLSVEGLGQVDVQAPGTSAQVGSGQIHLCPVPNIVSFATCTVGVVLTQDADNTDTYYAGSDNVSLTRSVVVPAAGTTTLYLNMAVGITPSPANHVRLFAPTITAMFFPQATVGTLSAATAKPVLEATVASSIEGPLTHA
jgi:hypothetical protein